MTRRRLLLRCGLVCAALGACLPAVASAAWMPPQDLGPAGFSYDDNALASNARGDAVVAFSQSPGIYVARAAPGAPFGAARRVSTEGTNPRVAIDSRGVALISWEYEDGSYEEYEDERGSDPVTCCTGTKVIVWQPGSKPTRSRAALRRGRNAYDAELAAVRGRRGLVVETNDRNEENEAVRFVPIRIDGRPGKARTVTRRWAAESLQFVAGRAVVGLVIGRKPARVATRRQRPNGSFGRVRTFLRVPEQVNVYVSPRFSEILLTPDGRGGHVVVLQRGQRHRVYVQIVRKPSSGRLRRVIIQRGRADNFNFSRPSIAADGWVAVAFKRVPDSSSEEGTGYVAAISPGGRARVTKLTGNGFVGNPAASVRAGGTGAAGFVETFPGLPFRGQGTWLALAGGLPQPAEALIRTAGRSIGDAVMTSNQRDRARIVFAEDGRLLASRLE